MRQFPISPEPQPGNPGQRFSALSRRDFLAATLTGWLATVTLCRQAKADSLPPEDAALSLRRQRYAVADLRLASEWMATSYEITHRVPQEMLLAGHSYADTMIALAMMSKGASLNELMDNRAYDRWDVIAKKVELDPQALPPPIRELVPHGPEQSRAPVLHFLPDVYVGQVRDLSFNAFTPTMPTRNLIERYRLNHYEVNNIRMALLDPLGVPEKVLLETGGRGGLLVGDWIIAGVLTHLKPMGIDTVLAARTGERLSWAECCLAFGLRPDALTEGPLSGVYPIVTGYAPNTVMCARRRRNWPDVIPLSYDLQNLNKEELSALYPLLFRCYRLGPEEQAMLIQNNYEVAEKGLMAALSRLARVDLGTIMDLHRSGSSYRAIVGRFTIDLTGQEGVKAVIDAREPAVNS